MDDYQLAICAAKTVAGRIGYPVCDDDLADMIQEAYLAIWETRRKSEKYRLGSGKIRAKNWLIWWIYGAKWDKIRGMRISAPVSIDNYEKTADILQEEQNIVDLEDEIRKIIFAVSKNGRLKAYIERDVEILTRICNGDTTAGIAMELGLSLHRINCHRQLVRKRLEKWMKRNEINICYGQN